MIDFIEEPQETAALKESLTPEGLEMLADRGYTIVKKIGEGMTRDTVLVRYQKGGVDKHRAMKIPKREVDPTSLCTLINRSKKDLDAADTVISNEIQHPGIAEVYESFRLNDGRTIVIEEYVKGNDLQTLIETMGPLRDEERIKNIFGQAIDALVYLNCEEHILHRDIKPSNTLVSKSGKVKLTDKQNAAKLWDVEELSMPSRGGTPYTHIDLINALATGKKASANDRTEVYALGATMFYALTGENPFNYKIVAADEGKELVIGGETFRIKLKDGENDLEKITDKEHEVQLKKAIKKVPKKYQNLVYRCLTTKKKAFYNMNSVKKYFDNINSDFAVKFKDAACRGIKTGLTTAIAGGVLALMVGGVIISTGREREPTLQDILSEENYKDFKLESISAREKEYIDDMLVPYMKSARTEMQNQDTKTLKHINNYVGFASSVHYMPKRLVAAWLTACSLHKGHEEEYKKEGEERLFPSFVPKDFLIRNDRFYSPANLERKNVVTSYGIMYLKHCLGPGKNVGDVYATYFSSTQERHTARVRTESMSYFPTIITKGNGSGTIKPGYAHFIPLHQRELINTAIALYMITDEDGNIDFKRIPEVTRPGRYQSLSKSIR